jgi:hypothetical protein
MMNSFLLSVVVTAFSLTNVSVTEAFTATSNTRPATASSSCLHAISQDTRRTFLTTTTASLLTTLLPSPALAADSPPTPEELSRIKTGYENIQYLLSHWEEETTVCRENGGECKRDADAVRRYLGLRSTKDPLFQIEKVFAKVKYMDNIDVDKLEAFFEATEDW